MSAINGEARDAAIAARLKAATPGPWHQKDAWNIECPECGEEKYVCDVTAEHEDGTEYLSLMVQLCGLQSLCAPNATFIAHAPEDVAWLLAELGRVRAERDEAMRAKGFASVQEYHDDYWRVRADRDAARALLEKIAAYHQGCDDGFYACPQHPDYFGEYTDKAVPIEQRPCYCWANEARDLLASRGARGGVPE